MHLISVGRLVTWRFFVTTLWLKLVCGILWDSVIINYGPELRFFTFTRIRKYSFMFYYIWKYVIHPTNVKQNSESINVIVK